MYYILLNLIVQAKDIKIQRIDLILNYPLDVCITLNPNINEC